MCMCVPEQDNSFKLSKFDISHLHQVAGRTRSYSTIFSVPARRLQHIAFEWRGEGTRSDVRTAQTATTFPSGWNAKFFLGAVR